MRQQGNGVFYWGLWSVKYKNGKKITFWMHNANHFNDAGKVDQVGQFLDRASKLSKLQKRNENELIVKS